ncbi:MAG: amidase [Eubacteriales bacterium]|nr:amidase [Kiritimatiellia bacterium]MDD4743455.1 amidase [Eubacteriales bacterium]
MLEEMKNQMTDVQAGRITVETLARQRLDRLTRKNPAVNAVVEYHPDELILQAQSLDRQLAAGQSLVLAGTFVTVKDNLNVKGMKSTAGLRKLKDNLAGSDSEAVARLRQAGALILGKTNMAPAAMDVQTDNPVYGRTNHPCFPERTCGGSSGGGACAVRLGISDVDVGNDIMGSIRIPASFCGVCGFVPTGGTISLDGFAGGKPMGSSLSRMLRIGLQARTLGDIQTVLPVVLDKHVPFIDETAGHPLRIAWSDDCGHLPLSDVTKKRFASFRQVLAAAHELYPLQPNDFDFDLARRCFIKLFYGALAAMLPPPVVLIEKYVFQNRFLNSQLKDYLQAENELATCTRQLEELFDRFDCLIVPVTATPAFLHQKPDKMRGVQPIYRSFLVDGQKTSYASANLGYTTPFCTAHPVIAMPIGKSEEGLPIGVQVVCGYHREKKLLTVVHQLQALIGS